MKLMRNFAVTQTDIKTDTFMNLAAGKQYFDHNCHALTYNIDLYHMHMSIYLNISFVNISESELHSHPDLTVNGSSKTRLHSHEIIKNVEFVTLRVASC